MMMLSGFDCSTLVNPRKLRQFFELGHGLMATNMQFFQHLKTRFEHALLWSTLTIAVSACGTAPKPLEAQAIHIQQLAQTVPQHLQLGHAPNPPLKLDLTWYAEQIAHKTTINPDHSKTFNFRLHNIPAAQVLELLSNELNVGYELDACAQKPISLVGRNMPLHTVLASIGKQTEGNVKLTPQVFSLKCEQEELRLYKLDYLALTRNMNDSSTLSSALASQNRSAGLQRDTGNRSELVLNNAQEHNLWENLTVQIEQLIQSLPKPTELQSTERVTDHESDRAFESNRGDEYRVRPRLSPNNPKRSNTLTNSNRRDVVTTRKEVRSGKVIVNPEAGTVAVIAKPSAHERVAQWLNHTQRRIDRQILIEAVIAEISLNDRYARGIDWNILRKLGTQAGLMVQGSGLSNAALTLSGRRNSDTTEASVVLQLLEEFGRASVLSSPRVVAMNQQPSVLKVIDNRVYFTTDVQTSAPTTNTPAYSIFNTEVQTVPVGFLMTVTPQISDTNSIQLRVRPTISRIVGFVQDPNPSLKQFNIISQVPEIQTRELESILKLKDGEMALLGGLRQRETRGEDRGIPGMPDVLNAVSQSTSRDQQHIELVVLLKAIVIDPKTDFEHSQLGQHDDHSHPATQNPITSNVKTNAHNELLNQGLREGLAFAKAGQTLEAQHLLQSLAQQFPEAPEPWHNLALLAGMVGQRELAQEHLARSVGLCAQLQCRLPHLSVQTLLQHEVRKVQTPLSNFKP